MAVLRLLDDVLAIVLQAETVEADVFPAQLDGQRFQPVERADLTVDREHQRVAAVDLAVGDVARLLGRASPRHQHPVRGRELAAQAVGIQNNPLRSPRPMSTNHDDPGLGGADALHRRLS